jgi:hypothetical protein
MFLYFFLHLSKEANCQIIQPLGFYSSRKIEFVTDKFQKNVDDKHYFYEYNSSELILCYYPLQEGLNCGYFTVNGETIYIDSTFDKNNSCDFDYGSFKLFKIIDGKNNIYILNTIVNGSGNATRKMFHNCFIINENKFLKFVPLWGVYSNEECFGDFNNDGKLDFLEIRYNEFDPFYKLSLYTMNEDFVFIRDENFKLEFERTIKNDKTIIQFIKK